MTINIGDTIGLIHRVLFDMQGRENYWKLCEGKVKSITQNSRGRRIKADNFRTLDADEVEFNTDWMLKTDRLVMVCEPFILTDELRERAERWIGEQEATQ